MTRTQLISKIAQIISAFPCGRCPKCDKDSYAIQYQRCWDMYMEEAKAVADYIMPTELPEILCPITEKECHAGGLYPHGCNLCGIKMREEDDANNN